MDARRRWIARAACLSMALALGAGTAFGQSKYAKVKNGVGNILVGEVLPYNDDAGYKNVVQDSVKLSQMGRWETFYYRAFIANKLKDISHDARVLVIHFEGQGKKAAQFAREAGGNYILVSYRKDDPDSYGERSEWAMAYADFQTDPQAVVLTGYRKEFDYTKPETFTFRTLEDDLGDEQPFTPATLRSWKSKYGLTAIDVTMYAYSFVDGGKVSDGENKKVLQQKDDGSFEETEKLGKVRTYTSWDDKRFLASGKFRIELD